MSYRYKKDLNIKIVNIQFRNKKPESYISNFLFLFYELYK